MAGKPAHLRAVTPDEAPAIPAEPIDSVTAAVLRGTPVDVVEQSLLVAARALDDVNTPAVAKAALLNRVTELRRELEAVRAEQRQEADGHIDAAGPEAWDATAI